MPEEKTNPFNELVAMLKNNEMNVDVRVVYRSLLWLKHDLIEMSNNAKAVAKVAENNGDENKRIEFENISKTAENALTYLGLNKRMTNEECQILLNGRF